MKKLILFAAIIFQVAWANAQQVANLQWAKAIVGSNSYAKSVTIDASGNVYTIGTYSGTVDFDPNLTTYTLASIGSTDMFISKLDANGNFVWAKSIGSNTINTPTSIAVDGSGNVYATGSFEGTVDFNPGLGVYTIASAGVGDIFILKLDVNGNFVWAKSMGGTSGDVANSLTLDGSGNIYTGGTFNGTVDFDPGVASYTLTIYGGNNQSFISKLDVNGNFVWAKAFAGFCSAITLDATGSNVCAVGAYNGIVPGDFDPSPITSYTLAGYGNNDVFVLKLNASGNFVWAVVMGGSTADRGNSITVDASGNVYTTGIYTGVADFDPGVSNYPLSTAGAAERFISKLDANGNFVWAKSMQGSETSQNPLLASDIALDASGNVYTTGYFITNTDFDPSLATYSLASLGSRDIYILKLDASGNFLWVKSMGGTSNDYATSIKVVSNNVYLSGNFSGTSDFNPNAGIYNLTAQGGNNAYVLKLRQCLSVSANPVNATPLPNLTICSGLSAALTASVTSGPGTYTLNWLSSPTSTSVLGTGLSYSTPVLSAGSYTYYASNTSTLCGISDAVPFNVTVNITPTISVTSGSICSNNSYTIVASGANTYTYSGGSSVVTPTANTSYSVTGTSSLGCVSSNTAVSNVTVNSSPTITVNSGSTCSGNSFTINPTGANTYTYSNGNSIVTPTTNTSYSVTGTSSLGCVSSNTAVSNVTVNALPIVSVTSGSICSGNSYTIVASGANTYTYSGGSSVVTPTANTSYSVTGTSSLGCLSSNTAVSNVTVNALPTVSATASSTLICTGQPVILTATTSAATYTWNTGVISLPITVYPGVTTTYTVSAINANGCIGNASVSVIVNACTGIKELSIDLISIYPNPNNGLLNISLTKSLTQNSTIEIYDALGKLVVKQILDNELNSVNMYDLENGIYIFKVLNNNTAIKVGKLIKQ